MTVDFYIFIFHMIIVCVMCTTPPQTAALFRYQIAVWVVRLLSKKKRPSYIFLYIFLNSCLLLSLFRSISQALILEMLGFARAELVNPSCSYFSLRCMIAGFVALRGPQECFGGRHGVLHRVVHRAHRDKDPDKKCTHRGWSNNVNKNKSANKESCLRNRLT